MARARFAKAVSPVSTKPARASVREALWFDVRSTESADETSLAEARIGSFDYAALLMFATHLLVGIA